MNVPYAKQPRTKLHGQVLDTQLITLRGYDQVRALLRAEMCTRTAAAHAGQSLTVSHTALMLLLVSQYGDAANEPKAEPAP